ncbi:tetratricopeptide repeat-containing protein [Toxoplasma gondii ARI]|uniref:Tetratricopeptide repeat-containing protein n=1 Tax=Toxoplasma gondii ARI TaxID=1074872 RepID=A0A139XVV2_TOXGO|nr:tetratricopeptide repeat-containing protein [Toxoplasma gondii ARI]
MEEEATKIMSAYCSGNYSAVEDAFKRMDKDLFKHAVRRARELGNSAFTNGKYEEAIKYYNEALAGEEASQKHSLLSNRSACYFLLGDNEKALEDARTCIQLKREWPKGWFRAGRVLFAIGKYSGAVSAFTMAKRHEVDAMKLRELDLWIDKSEKLAHKAKLVARVTTEYSRFDGIEDPDDELAQALSADVDTGGCPIEFSEQLSEKQKRQLEMLLTGKADVSSFSEKRTRTLSFCPSMIFSELPNFSNVLRESARSKCSNKDEKSGTRLRERTDEETKKQRLRLEAPVALCRYLQLTTELREPRKLAGMLNTVELSAFTDGLSAVLENVLSNKQISCNSWLFLGTGTSEVAKQMVHRNGVSALVNVVRQRIEGVECADDASDPLDHVTKDMSKKAEVLVIDLSMLDEALLGRRLIPQVRFARKNLCQPDVAVYPSRATVFVEAFSVTLPPTKTGYQWGAVETAVRWNPYAEPTALRVTQVPCPTGPPSSFCPVHNGDVAVPLSDPHPVFQFTFDGHLEELDQVAPALASAAFYLFQDLPLHREETIVLPCTGTGVLNAFVVWYKLCARFKKDEAVSHPDDEETLVLDGTPHSTSVPPCCRSRQNELNGSACSRRPAWRHAVFWIDPVTVEEGQVLTVKASHTSSRLRFKLVSPRESPKRTQQFAIARYHLDLLRDPELLGHLEAGLARVARTQLDKIRKRMQRYEQLAGSSKAEDLPVPPCLSILCAGAAPAPLPFLAGHAAADEIVRSEGCSAGAWQQHHKRIQRYHVTVVDPWTGNIRACRRVASDNRELLLEQCLAPTVPMVADTKWRPVSDLIARENRSGKQRASLQDKREQSNCNTIKERSCESAAPRLVIPEEPGTTKEGHDALLKAKVKERFSFLEKDVRQLKPPRGEEDAAALLALGELYQLPPGSDIKAHLERIDEADPEEAELCRLTSPALMCVLGLFDYGCLGEGALPLSKFIAKVLMNKREGVFVPRRARIFAVLVEIGKASVGGVDAETWRTYRYVPDYGGVDLDEEAFVPLGDPFEAWEFDFSENTLADQASPLFARATKELTVNITHTGELNAVVFWFELEVDELLTISTAPNALVSRIGSTFHKMDSSGKRVESKTQSLAHGSQNSSAHTTYHTKAWKQACQMLAPVEVVKGQKVSVGTAHDSTKILFRVTADQEQNERSRPLSDPSWVNMAERHQQLSNTWMKVLCNSSGDNDDSFVSQVSF